MPVELMDAIDGANATSPSADRLVAQDDGVLVAAAKTGDARAFELLVERHERKIFSLAQRMTRNREDAEDVVQQSFQKAFIHLEKFEGESLFSTWLTRIAINEALMLLRRKRGSREVPIAESNTEDESALPLDIPDLGPNPEDSCLQREQERILSAAVSELTPGMRKAIELRELFHGRRKLRQTLRRYVESTRTYGNQALRTKRAVRDHSRAMFELRPAC
jgi:RNA polymerase sigma-70 factor (ECF subfamily)